MKTKAQAIEDGKALAKRLGPGWTSEVWETIGWHYKAVSKCGRWKIHSHKYPGTPRDYTALLGEAGSPSGIWAEHGKTPEQAIKATWKRAQKEIAFYSSFNTANPKQKR